LLELTEALSSADGGQLMESCCTGSCKPWSTRRLLSTSAPTRTNAPIPAHSATWVGDQTYGLL